MAVFDVERSGRPRQYDTDAEARVIALACSTPTRQDYEYVRNGTTTNLFVAVEPKAGQRIVSVTELGILSRQCLDWRLANRELLESEVDAWQQTRNEEKRTLKWNFTRQDADLKLGPNYVSKLEC